MSSSPFQTQEPVPSQRISEASDQSDSGNGGTSVTVSNIDNTDNSTSTAVDSNKRPRSQGEDSSSEDPDHPAKKAKSAPICAEHPFLFNVRTAVKYPYPLPFPFNVLLGTPPTRPNCGICLDTFSHETTEDLARHDQCAPIYHTACLERWAREGSPTCPNCRGRLEPPPLFTPETDHFNNIDIGRAHWLLETLIRGYMAANPSSQADRFMLAVRAEFGLDDEGGYEDDVEVEEEEVEEEVTVSQQQQDQAADDEADGDQQQEDEHDSGPPGSQGTTATPSDRSFWNII